MKKVTQILILILLIFSACSGSDTYRGSWKATDPYGNKFEIEFLPKSFSVKDTSGKVNNFEYTQHTVSIENSIETYGIRLSDGRGYIINFPVANDESIGIIMDGGGIPIYTISRNEYKKYEDIYKLN